MANSIKEHRKAKGFTLETLAEATELSPGFISRMESGSRGVKLEHLLKISKALGVSIDQLADLSEIEGSSMAQIQSMERTPGFTPDLVPGRQLVGERNFPVYAAAMGGDGHAIITFDAIEYVKRPSILENVKDAYGVYIVGDSMDPVYEPGDMALIHPHLPPARGKDVVLFHVPPAQEAECIIKRLVGFNDQDWKLKQYNPAKEFSEPRASWPYCHRVVGKYSGR